jgi:hypothetical protein
MTNADYVAALEAIPKVRAEPKGISAGISAFALRSKLFSKESLVLQYRHSRQQTAGVAVPFSQSEPAWR